jgi:Uma2 family endonuclease
VLGLERDPERLRGPDVSFVSRARLERYGGVPEKRGYLHGPPDLVVEVDSPSRPKHKHMQPRILDFLDAGVRLLWIIHSEANCATVYHPDGSARLLRETDSLDGEDVLPGLVIPLHEIFND